MARPVTKPPKKRRLVKRLLSLIVLMVILIAAGVLVYHFQHKPSAVRGNPKTSTPLPVPGSFPNASDSGIPSGTTLTAYSGPFTISVAGTTVDGKQINGCLTIAASNVTIKDSLIICKKKAASSVDISMKGISNVLIEASEVNGSDLANEGVNGSNFTLNQVNIHGSHDGIHEGSNDVVENSYVHDLSKLDGIHSDTVQVVKGNSAANDLFNHDTFDATLPGGVRLNSAFHVGDNLNQNFVIENSYLDGGSYTLQFDPKIPAGHTIEIINNAFGRDCNDGIFDGGSGVTFSGNYWADTHQSITAADAKHGGCNGKTN